RAGLLVRRPPHPRAHQPGPHRDRQLAAVVPAVSPPGPPLPMADRTTGRRHHRVQPPRPDLLERAARATLTARVEPLDQTALEARARAPKRRGRARPNASRAGGP